MKHTQAYKIRFTVQEIHISLKYCGSIQIWKHSSETQPEGGYQVHGNKSFQNRDFLDVKTVTAIPCIIKFYTEHEV